MSPVPARRPLRMAPGRHRSGGAQGPGPTENYIVRLGLSHDMPDRQTVIGKPLRKVYGHLFTPHAIRFNDGLDNRVLVPRVLDTHTKVPDYVDTYFLPDVPPYGTAYAQPKLQAGVVAGSASDYNQEGGLFRDRPPRMPDGGVDWKINDRKQQITWARDAGLDGFFVDNLYDPPTEELRVFDAVQQMGLIGDFGLIPMLDMTGGLKNRTAAYVATHIQKFTAHPACDKIGSRFQIAYYQPENLAPSFYDAVRAALTSAGVAVDIYWCFQNKTVYGAGNGAEQYATATGDHPGRWGDRDYGTIGSLTPQNRLQAVTHDQAFPARYGRSLGYVAPGDTRPNGHRYWENGGPRSLLTSWEVVQGDKNPPAYDGLIHQPSMVQLTTINDYSEGAGFENSRNHRGCIYAVSALEILKYKGIAVDIVRDTLYLTHRIQFSSGMTYTNTSQTQPQVLQQSAVTPAEDKINVLVDAVSAADVEITRGDPDLGTVTTTTHTVAAGRSIVTVPLLAGAPYTISTRMLRGGVEVPNTAVASPWPVSHRVYSMDMDVRWVSSRDVKSADDPSYYIPRNPTVIV